MAAQAGSVGVVISYQPWIQADPIPTLGGMMLVVLALALGVMAWRVGGAGLLHSHPLVAVLLTATIVVTGLSGLRQVYALALAPQVELNQAGGGQASSIHGEIGTFCFVNTSGAPLQITAIEPHVWYAIDSSGYTSALCPKFTLLAREGDGSSEIEVEGAPECSANPPTQLPANQACYLTIEYQ